MSPPATEHPDLAGQGCPRVNAPPPSAHLGTGGADRVRAACGDSLPFPATGPPPRGATSTQSRSPTAPQSRAGHGSRPPRPRHPPPDTPFLFPFPARLVSSAPRQLATPRAALGRRPEGLDLLRFVSVQLAPPPCRWMDPMEEKPAMLLPDVPPWLPGASSPHRGWAVPQVCPTSMGRAAPDGTGAELWLCWVTSVPG